jgi:hypothetical protein
MAELGAVRTVRGDNSEESRLGFSVSGGSEGEELRL